MRITPFLVFADGKRERRIKHGVQHVDEGDMGNDHAKKLGAHVRHRAHEEPASAAALNHEFFRRRVSMRNQVFGSSDKVRERIALLFHAASVVPRLSELAASADVRDGVDHATVQQARAVRTEIDRHGNSIAAVTIEKKRRGAVTQRIAAIDDGKRHARPVGSGGMQALADVLRWIVAAENRLLLPQASFSCANVIVKDGARSHERFILEPHVGGGEFRVLTEGGVVCGLGEFNAMRSRKGVRSTRR